MSRIPLSIDEIKHISTLQALTKVLKDLLKAGADKTDERVIDLSKDIIKMNKELIELARDVEEEHRLSQPDPD
jgi:hypothetical protein